MILFDAAWRLFFLAAGLFAGIAIPAWLALFSGMPGMSDPTSWHRHEMLFGFVTAAAAGFLLTAVPNWTGKKPLSGAPLAALFALWLAGRLAMALAPEALAAQLIALAFLPLLAAWVGWAIVTSNNRRNLVVIGLIALLWLAEVVTLFGDSERGTALGFGAVFMLIVLIGGRVTPNFTRNWLMMRAAKAGQRQPPALPGAFGPIDKAALALSAAFALSWVALGDGPVTGALAGAAAVALAARLARWKGWGARGEPLMLALHAGYGWLALAAGVMALDGLFGLASLSQVRHAMGAGVVGSMTAIMMLRAVIGHGGGQHVGTRLDWALFGLIHLGAALRLGADWTGNSLPFIHAGGTLWALGFLLFAWRVWPYAIARRDGLVPVGPPKLR